MKTKYSVVKITKNAMTGEAVAPSLLLLKIAAGVFGEVVFTGSKAAAKQFLAVNRNQ